VARGKWTVAKEEGQTVARKPAATGRKEVIPFKVTKPAVVPLSALQKALKEDPKRKVRVIRP
jgi:hypothetical protein